MLCIKTQLPAKTDIEMRKKTKKSKEKKRKKACKWDHVIVPYKGRQSIFENFKSSPKSAILSSGNFFASEWGKRYGQTFVSSHSFLRL